MTADEQLAELRHRFRLALLGYIVLAGFTIAALVVGFVLEREINTNQQRTEVNTRHLAAILAGASYHVCVGADQLKTLAKVDDKINCEAARQTADEVYAQLTK